MPVELFQVDAFTNRAFAGNPAAVCLLPEEASSEWMQSVAMEMNLSETAFLLQQEDGFNLRWFTPAIEIELCGHATLASAHVLYETGILEPEQQARFHTLSGLLSAQLKDEWVELDFPARPIQPAEAPAGLAEALGTDFDYVGKTKLDFLVEVGSEETVRGLAPDFGMLKDLSLRAVVVTARAASPEFDFVSRFFGPAVGIDEDPVTGAAHCILGPYWSDKLGKQEFLAYQASARGGVVRVTLAEDRVHLGGQAVTVLRGQLLTS